MDTDRIKGAVRRAAGSVKEAVGKATGNRKMQAEGNADRAAGKTQNAEANVKNIADRPRST